MAEINIKTNARIENGSFRERWSSDGELEITQNAIGASSGVLSIGTSEENITFTDISTEGVLFVRNLDSTNFVKWGPQVGTGSAEFIGRLKAGEEFHFRMEPGATLRMIADTSSVNVQYLLLED